MKIAKYYIPVRKCLGPIRDDNCAQIVLYGPFELHVQLFHVTVERLRVCAARTRVHIH
jgi:hypothetical protein